MKMTGLIFSILFCFTLFAQQPAPEAAQPLPAAPVVAAPAVAMPPLTAVEKAELPQLEVKDESLVPPTWLQDVIVAVKGFPVVGPYLVMLLQWLGVLSAILTALCAFLLISVKAVNNVLNLMKLTEFAAKIAAFEKGKVMYWLKYLSMFNAPQVKKDDSK